MLFFMRLKKHIEVSVLSSIKNSIKPNTIKHDR
jgi:hypothetical protein